MCFGRLEQSFANDVCPYQLQHGDATCYPGTVLWQYFKQVAELVGLSD